MQGYIGMTRTMRYGTKGGILTGSGTRVSRSIVQRAEALLRALIGVSQAEVNVRASGGVEQVRLVADGGLSNGQIVQNVRSALLAALGVALQPSQIVFVDAASWTPASTKHPPSPLLTGLDTDEAGAGPAGEAPAATEANEDLGNVQKGNPGADTGLRSTLARGGRVQGENEAESASGRDSPRAGHTPGDRPAHRAQNGDGCTARAGNGHGNGSRQDLDPHGPAGRTARRQPGRAAPLPAGGLASAIRSARSAEEPQTGPSGTNQVAIGLQTVRLERVETLRQAGRLRCRVVLAAGADHYSAVADCTDEPLAELQLAARVTCDALRAGELTQAHFEAATVANLGGGMHVLVALGGWSHGEAIHRSGSAVIKESAEHAAALAVLNALART